MARLFIANVNKQDFLFSYRVAERANFVTQKIEAGKQICIAPHGSNTDLMPDVIHDIIRQHEKYGLQDADRISMKGEHPFSGLCYSIGGMVAESKLAKAAQLMDKMLKGRGERIRQDAGVVANYEIEHQVREDFQLKKLSMDIEEMPPPGGRGFSDDHTHIAERHSITRNPDGAFIDIAKRGTA